uniref:Uncharacterized protein n=1 Tax=Varanus komodoensis TaxID=61221 RepID=A0A8D2J545_VARKO
MSHEPLVFSGPFNSCASSYRQLVTCFFHIFSRPSPGRGSGAEMSCMSCYSTIHSAANSALGCIMNCEVAVSSPASVSPVLLPGARLATDGGQFRFTLACEVILTSPKYKSL